MLDVGELAWVRFEEDTATTTATFQEVLAPGGHLTVGLGRTPFALIAGGMWTPYGETDWRMSAGLTADLVLWK